MVVVVTASPAPGGGPQGHCPSSCSQLAPVAGVVAGMVLRAAEVALGHGRGQGLRRGVLQFRHRGRHRHGGAGVLAEGLDHAPAPGAHPRPDQGLLDTFGRGLLVLHPLDHPGMVVEKVVMVVVVVVMAAAAAVRAAQGRRRRRGHHPAACILNRRGLAIICEKGFAEILPDIPMQILSKCGALLSVPRSLDLRTTGIVFFMNIILLNFIRKNKQTKTQLIKINKPKNNNSNLRIRK